MCPAVQLRDKHLALGHALWQGKASGFVIIFAAVLPSLPGAYLKALGNATVTRRHLGMSALNWLKANGDHLEAYGWICGFSIFSLLLNMTTF